MLYIAIALVPLAVGLVSRVWFLWLMRPVRSLNNGARWIDPEVVKLPADAGLTIKKIREHDKWGDKIVVAHHLAGWTLDLQRMLFWTLGLNSVLSLLFVVGAVVLGDPDVIGHKESLKEILAPTVTSKPFLLSFAGAATTIFICVRLVADQAHKYRGVIVEARPLTRSVVAKFIDRVRSGDTPPPAAAATAEQVAKP